MKRFYCTICGHVKRVTQLPLNVRSQDAHLPINRIGQCERHDAHQVHPRRVGPLPKVRVAVQKRAESTPSKASQRASHKQSSKGAK